MRSIFRVEWSIPAKLDLVDIVRFIARDSPENAAKVSKRIRTPARTLRTSPERGRVVPELADLGTLEYRELLVYPYRIIYHVQEKMVYVRAVIDGRRDVRQVLAERLALGEERTI